MKKAALITYSLLLALVVSAQKTNTGNARVATFYNESSVIKDSAGTIYPYALWRQLVSGGHYTLKPENPVDSNTAYILVKLTDAQYEAKMSALPKPRESNFFKTGAAFSYFKTRDMNGDKINSKTLEGKILVLNYWFINCPPCRAEIPELNKLVEKYKDDSSVVFVAVALDDRQKLKEFLKSNPYKYRIVDDGRYIASENNVSAYPTNVIVDHQGKVYFHTSGFGGPMMYWMEKSITEIKKSMLKKDAPAGTQ